MKSELADSESAEASALAAELRIVIGALSLSRYWMTV